MLAGMIQCWMGITFLTISFEESVNAGMFLTFSRMGLSTEWQASSLNDGQ